MALVVEVVVVGEEAEEEEEEGAQTASREGGEAGRGAFEGQAGVAVGAKQPPWGDGEGGGGRMCL